MRPTRPAGAAGKAAGGRRRRARSWFDRGPARQTKHAAAAGPPATLFPRAFDDKRLMAPVGGGPAPMPVCPSAGLQAEQGARGRARARASTQPPTAPLPFRIAPDPSRTRAYLLAKWSVELRLGWGR